MRCALSFLAVIVLSFAVVAIGMLIIWFTPSEDSFIKCMTPEKACNSIIDCPNGEDEDPMFCVDLSTMNSTLEILIRKPAKVKLEDAGEKKPEICEYRRLLVSNKTIGVICDGRKMNETLNGIPWAEFYRLSQIITIAWGALNTTVLVPPAVNVTGNLNFPLLHKLYIDDNYIEMISDNALCNLQALGWLSMVRNSLRTLSPDSFCLMENLSILKLSGNKLHLEDFQFKNMPRLSYIELDQNEIEKITELTFSGLPDLQNLNLSCNKISSIHPEAFSKSLNLLDLDLSFNNIHTISPLILQHQSNLKKLYITGNSRIRLPLHLFQNLTNLRSLNIDTLEITQLDTRSFQFTPNLDLLFFKKFSYCRYVPRARRCYPYSDGLSSNSNLLIGQSRVTVWLVGILTILGNISVLANRWALRKQSTSRAEITEILNVFLNNLALADLLMGVYLIVLAFKDVQFRGIYNINAYKWGASKLCSVIGILALISSEVSLLILTIMSLERYLTIGSLSQRKNLTVNLARASMIIIWIFASILAIAPAIPWRSTGNTGFYGSTGLCFPIHLDERYPVGWQYTTFVFIGVNSACLVLISVSYSLLFFTVIRTQRRTPLFDRNIELASRFFLMVFTDVLCWAPIIFLKGRVLGGVELSQKVIGWAVIYMLPLNSAVNPILYTFSTNEVRLAIKSHLQRMMENIQMNWLLPRSERQGNSVEPQNIKRRKDNTAGTEDTELTHSVCATVSGRESRSWYST